MKQKKKKVKKMVLFVLFCAAEDVWEEEYETEWLALASANIMGFIFCLKEINFI